MNVTVKPAYSRPFLKNETGASPDFNDGFYFSTDIGNIMINDLKAGYWQADGNLHPSAICPDLNLSVRKSWAVLINDQIFRMCPSKAIAEQVKDQVIKTMNQIEELNDDVYISYANLFNLKHEFQKVEDGYKRVNLE